MKKIKYLLLVCAVAVCLAGCSDAAEEITSEDAGNSEIVEDGSSEETVDSEEVVSEEESFCGDWEVLEEWGKTPFWLKYGLQGLETKDLSQTQLYGCMTPGSTVAEILTSDEYTYFNVYFSDVSNSSFSTGNAEEILNISPDTKVSSGGYINIYMHPSEDDTSFVEITVYNLSDETLCASEVLANNQFYMEEAHDGFNTDLVFDDERKDLIFGMNGSFDRNYLINVADMLGHPDIIYSGIKEELSDFEEKLKTGDGILSYIMFYDRDDYFLIVNISEYNITNDYDLGSITLIYTTPDLYTYLDEETSSGSLINESYRQVYYTVE